MTYQCPHCGGEINVGSLLGSAKSRAKTKAARENAKLGGWPKGKKRGKRKPDANQLAHSIVAKAAKLARKGIPFAIMAKPQGQTPPVLEVPPSRKAPKLGR